MNIDIIITTYNRPNHVIFLVESINTVLQYASNIIVSDSSDVVNKELKAIKNVKYIQSSHKNQPYQRYLGLLKSKADWVLFLDDDLEIIEDNFLDLFIQISKIDPYFIGAGSVILFPDQQLKERKWWYQLILFFTGEPFKSPGELSLFGEFGGICKKKKIMLTSSLSGACMFLKRDVAMSLFSDTLLSLFERRWAMGEDKYLSFKASLQGNIYLLTTPLFRHPPIESTYFTNIIDFQARVLYSRVWLAQFIGKNKGYSNARIFLQTLYYITWRVLISLLKSFTGNKAAFERFKGNIIAIDRILAYGFDPKKLTPGINWQKELEKDLNYE